MNMRQRAPKIVNQWIRLGVALTLLHVFWLLGWLVLAPSTTRPIWPILVLTLIYVILLTAILAVFIRRIGQATISPEYAEAAANGIPASAKVLTIRRTRWRTERYRNFRLKPVPQRREYEMRVRVTRAGHPDYEAETAAYLAGSQVPDVGDIIPVRIHPQRPEIVVISFEDGSLPR